MRAPGRPPLPREHGSWVMLLAASLAGVGTAAAAGTRGAHAWPAVGLFLLAAVAFFCLRRPLSGLLRPQPGLERPAASFWLAVEAALAAAAGGALLLLGRPLLLPLGLAAAALLAVDVARAARSPRPTLASEAAGAVGLALVGPGAFYAFGGTLAPPAPGLGLLLALHFLSGVFYIRMKARWVRQPPPSATPGRPAGVMAARLGASADNAAYQVLALAAALAAARVGLLPPLGWLALLPAVLRGLAGGLLGKRETDFKRLGWRETAYTAAALALWFVALRLQRGA